MGRWLILALAISGCAPWAAQQQADDAFAKALSAQLSHQDDTAEAYYKQILVLGFDWSSVWNNLAAIEVHRHELRAARHLLARARAASDQDLIALTNYGVVSFWLSDLREAERAFETAQVLRRDLLNGIPTLGHDDYIRDRFARDTEHLARLAEKYLARIAADAKGETTQRPSDAELVADITSYRF